MSDAGQTPPDDEQDPEAGAREAAHQGSQGTDAEAHGGDGAEQSGPGGDAQAGSGAVPGEGGYDGRDPATDMPRVPSVPETQDHSGD